MPAQRSRGAARIAIADDHPLMRAALRQWVESRHKLEVCAEAENGCEAIDACERESPDVLVLDLGMPGMDGIAVTSALAARRSATRTLIYTGHDSVFEAVRAYRAGAHAFVVKHSSMDDFDAALERVVEGRKYFPDAMLGELSSHLLVRANPGGPKGDLTEREVEVLRLVAEGRGTTEIANTLGVSPRTVTRHKSRLHDKLGAGNDADLARRAIALGVISESAGA